MDILRCRGKRGYEAFLEALEFYYPEHFTLLTGQEPAQRCSMILGEWVSREAVWRLLPRPFPSGRRSRCPVEQMRRLRHSRGLPRPLAGCLWGCVWGCEWDCNAHPSVRGQSPRANRAPKSLADTRVSGRHGCAVSNAKKLKCPS